MYTGIGASAGIGIGSAVIVKEPSLAYDNKAVSDVDAEKKRLAEALDKCIAKTQAMADDMKERVGEKEAEILEGHVLLLMDPEMTGQMETSIADDKMCAEAAVEKICDYYMQMFSSIDDEMFQQRATDVCDIKTRLLKILLDVEDVDLANVPEGTVLVAEDLTPSMTAGINPKNVTGILTEVGGKTSHSAILARALEIPAVLSIPGITEKISNGDKVVLDGSEGQTYINPDEKLQAEYEQKRVAYLEEKAALAQFVGKEDSLCFSTGFTVNSGVIACLTGREDYIICDDRDHASIVDGRRLSFSTNLKYKHNDMADLERQLQKCAPEAVKLIVVDGVFSMEGDLANLPEIVRLKHKYNATIMVDEAHGIGVFGRQGRGVCDHFGLTDEVDLIMGTFSKSLASIGGFIAADETIINWLRHNARTYIFSASNTPAATAAALEALHIIQEEPQRIEALWDVTRYALKRFREAGFEIGETESPIIPLYVRDTEKTFVATARAFEEGVFINPVIPPACAPQDTLVRVALMATHTHEQVDRAVDSLRKVFVELGIIKD